MQTQSRMHLATWARDVTDVLERVYSAYSVGLPSPRLEPKPEAFTGASEVPVVSPHLEVAARIVGSVPDHWLLYLFERELWQSHYWEGKSPTLASALRIGRMLRTGTELDEVLPPMSRLYTLTAVQLSELRITGTLLVADRIGLTLTPESSRSVSRRLRVAENQLSRLLCAVDLKGESPRYMVPPQTDNRGSDTKIRVCAPIELNGTRVCGTAIVCVRSGVERAFLECPVCKRQRHPWSGPTVAREVNGEIVVGWQAIGAALGINPERANTAERARNARVKIIAPDVDLC